MNDRIDIKKQSDEYWKKKLTPEQFRILREKGTEAPFSGAFYLKHDLGMYVCVACGQELFSSDAKFDSDCGWPSFDRSIANESIELKDDFSFGMHRVEVVCKNCGGHLGHVFDDGPKETTEKRFCINSVSLHFQPKSPEK